MDTSMNHTVPSAMPAARSHAPIANLDTLDYLAPACPGLTLQADAVWVRAGMECLDPAVRSGWKIHVSSVPVSLQTMLNRALPVLRQATVPFKVIRSAEMLERMNDGRFGLTQVGKALTVYPAHEEESYRVAGALSTALQGLPGPQIPADSRFCSGAPVYFRFGAYDAQFTIDDLGQEHRILVHPLVGEVIDSADGGDTPPPLPRFMPVVPPYDHLAFLRDRFIFLRVLQVSAKGVALLAMENKTPPGPLCFIKSAKAHTHSDLCGRDALWALEREHHLLQRLAGLPGIPEAGTLERHDSDVAAIVRPYINGHRWWDLWTRPDARTPESRAALKTALAALAEVVSACHERGIVIRDLSPGNVLVNDQGVHILDFELAHDQSDPQPGYRRGTSGFFNPTADRFRIPGVEDDHYALAALARMADTGQHPAWFPSQEAKTPHVISNAGRNLETTLSTKDTAASLWTVYSGLSGLLLCAIEQDRTATLSPEHIHGLAAAAKRVQHIPGLYFGASGIGLTLWAIGSVQDDNALRDTARAIFASTWEQAADSRIPDLCHGWAGFCAAAISAHAFAPDTVLCNFAEAAGNRLLEFPREIGEDALEWPWPEGPYGTMSGTHLYGFAHGTAGVAHTLFRLHKMFPKGAYLDAANRAMETLRRAARPVAENAVWWPCSAQDETVWNAWCHGTPGVVKTLAQALTVRDHDEDRKLLHAALKGVACANNSGWCLCHGVASRLDAFVDARALLDAAEPPEWAENDAVLLSSLDLETLEREQCNGEAGAESGGLMTGAVGVARTLYRYARGSANTDLRLLP